jgi:hypothetical protein
MAAWKWALAGVVALGEMAVLALALAPEVSADYRAYYLDRSTACWPRPTTGDYVLGQQLSFRDDSAAGNTVCGWLEPFDAGTYSTGDRARLRFDFAVPDGGLMLGLVARGYVGPARLQQRVVVSANGQALGEIIFDSPDAAYHALAIPAEVAALDAEGVTLQFDFPDAISPRDMGVNEDTRKLGILLETLSVLPGR